jgi:FkbM family methyltransferase
MYPESHLEVNRRITEKYLNYDNGFFIEVGGADGVTQSNTWHLEMYKNWTGILVEPNVEAAKSCQKNRPKSTVFNYALVANDYQDEEITMLHRAWYNGDPGLTSSAYNSSINDIEQWNGFNYKFNIPATTLTDVIQMSNIENQTIDFLSLDAEGYELEILKGLDIKRFCPKIILIEWHLNIQDVFNVLDSTHKLEEQLSKHDYVFVLKD